MSKDPLFPMGQLLITRLALDTLSQADIHRALLCHARGDFGLVPEADKRANLFAIDHDERIVSKYASADGDEFYIITEHCRSQTTVLLTDEY